MYVCARVRSCTHACVCTIRDSFNYAADDLAEDQTL